MSEPRFFRGGIGGIDGFIAWARIESVLRVALAPPASSGAG
jgi:hypothetical protein